MEITRLPPFPLSFDEPDFEPSTDHVVAIFDDSSNLLVVIESRSNAHGSLHVQLPNWCSKYDDEYQIEFYKKDGTLSDGSPKTGDLVMMHTLTIFRPYIDIEAITTVPEETETAKMYEAIARSIIKTSTGGFEFKYKHIETTGLGADYLTLPYRINRLLEIKQNNIVVYSSIDPTFVNKSQFNIGEDKSTITVGLDGAWIRSRGRSPVPQLPASDSYTLHNTNDSPNIIQNVHGSPMFPAGWAYTITAEVGWPIIPNDIKIAAKLLIGDMKANTLPYLNYYIDSYKSEQYTLNFADGAYADTGNRTVDKILANYPRSNFYVGIL